MIKEYIERENLLDGITSPEFGLDEIIDNLIFEHNLDSLYNNNEDVVREFAKDLIDCIKNYIKTQSADDVMEIKHGEWVWNKGCGYDEPPYYCSLCVGKRGSDTGRDNFCSDCGAQMDGGKNNDYNGK
jgi:hypothetical protein